MSAGNGAHRLMKHDEIKARIEQLHKEQIKRLEATADRVLLEAGKLAFVNMRDLVDTEGKMIPLHELDPEVSAAITSIEYDEIYSGEGKHRKVIGRTTKVKISDKYKGLELLGKRLKVFSDKLEVTYKATLEDLLEQAANLEADK
jgi:phage terminase small subunit